MSEVQRITVLWPVGPHGYGNYPVVLASEYDAQRLRADTAEADLLRTSDALLAAEQRIERMSEVLHILRVCASISPELKRDIDAALNQKSEGESQPVRQRPMHRTKLSDEQKKLIDEGIRKYGIHGDR